VTMFADLSTFYQGPGDGRSWSDRWKHRTLNRQWLQGASRAACTSPNMCDYVRDTYGIEGDVVVAPYDPDERRVPPHRAVDAPLRVVHTGTIRPEVDRPEVLLDALDQLLASGSLDLDAMRVDLVGSQCETLLAETLKGRPCEAMVQLTESVSPAEAVRMQREADLLVMFNRHDPIAEATGISLSYPAKVFEYLNAQRPTIAVAADPSGFVGRLLSETNGGHTAEDAPSQRTSPLAAATPPNSGRDWCAHIPAVRRPGRARSGSTTGSPSAASSTTSSPRSPRRPNEPWRSGCRGTGCSSIRRTISARTLITVLVCCVT